MDENKRKRLEAAGWMTGSAYDFLEMTDEEASYVELKLALSAAVRKLRRRRKLTQVQFAELMRSSQSRMAKAEAGDASVSLDLLIRSLLTLGASNRDLAELISASAHT
ncbi:MAG: helix-turn-helix domain-containing protein [bacterium]|nr:helix-turn-helix domain-containing protein [bacterium]